MGDQLPKVADGQDAAWEWEAEARATLREGLASRVPEPLFNSLVRAAVLDPNPSFNRQFVEPAVAAFGRHRVLAALIQYLCTGTNTERAGAARAWYWARASLRFRGSANFEKGVPTPESQAEYDAVADLSAEWSEATLREFVANDDLDVRRCILPGLSLKPESHPAELHGLVAEAVRIARTHPDEYLRHRVEHQV
ncbi:hypothetical protein QZH56_36310 [Streptomyces olivoreticuli]|uniref:hypothetical protein n=1 Tax=Streptomyces olivoreticuli TaxID=68246 RepID=UPI002659EC81|nr:hypothetical protein [Streptomyces olivoreticuli]WKK24068.1 hypothetical protein QZH56_36310 [Streptomyces olivoreticuli]